MSISRRYFARILSIGLFLLLQSLITKGQEREREITGFVKGVGDRRILIQDDARAGETTHIEFTKETKVVFGPGSKEGESATVAYLDQKRARIYYVVVGGAILRARKAIILSY